nr:PREDICTED: uncharacterized protein LOC103988384 [Musa acuminata subsp. malaccensis]
MPRRPPLPLSVLLPGRTDAGGCGPGHRHHPLSFYSGCPAPLELSAMWSSLLGLSNNSHPQEGGLDKMAMMTIDQNCASNCWGAGQAVSSGMFGGHENSVAKFDPWVAVASSPSMAPPESNSVPPCGPEQQGFFHRECNLPKLSVILGYVMTASFVKVLALASLALTSISGYRIRWLCHGEEFVCCRIESTLETSSSVQQDCMALQSSDMFQPTNAGQIGSSSADPSFINVDNNRSGNFIFHNGNVCPTISLSLSNLTGESSAADYQDRGVSPTFLTGESTWDSNLEPGRPQARNEAKMRYNEKKKSQL